MQCLAYSRQTASTTARLVINLDHKPHSRHRGSRLVVRFVERRRMAGVSCAALCTSYMPRHAMLRAMLGIRATLCEPWWSNEYFVTK